MMHPPLARVFTFPAQFSRFLSDSRSPLALLLDLIDNYSDTVLSFSSILCDILYSQRHIEMIGGCPMFLNFAP